MMKWFKKYLYYKENYKTNLKYHNQKKLFQSNRNFKQLLIFQEWNKEIYLFNGGIIKKE